MWLAIDLDWTSAVDLLGWTGDFWIAISVINTRNEYVISKPLTYYRTYKFYTIFRTFWRRNTRRRNTQRSISRFTRGNTLVFVWQQNDLVSGWTRCSKLKKNTSYFFTKPLELYRLIGIKNLWNQSIQHLLKW